jgi:ABC-type multidrug transport system fused ATPase/permease subunit
MKCDCHVSGPLQIALYTALLYKYLGSSVFWGMGVLLVSIPINSIGLRILNRLTRSEIAARDARTKRTAESISNMKLLKLQGWDERFAQGIREHRKEELGRMVKKGVVRALLTAYSSGVPSLVLVVTLLAYVRQSPTLVASTIFTAISLFNQLRYPLFFFPMYIDSAANARQALHRIASYLASEENVRYVSHQPPISVSPRGPLGGSIEISDGNFLWSSESTHDEKHGAPALANVNFKANPGEIVAVVGTVGSGKSAVIKALLGELKPVPSIVLEQAITIENEKDKLSKKTSASDRPRVVMHGNVAYCSQEAWLPKGSVRDAIVFGREFDEERYNTAIRDAGLDRDLSSSSTNQASQSTSVLSHDTDVGEGGSSLSGGQRARVALARALYSADDTKVFLLDDCLAALDASVGSTVFERLSARLRKTNSVAILVTNDPSIPRRCDRTILMGKVAASSSCSTIIDIGTYDQLEARGHNLRSVTTTDLKVMGDGSDEELSDAEQDKLAFTSSHDEVALNADPIELRSLGESIVSNCTDDCHPDPECFQLMANCPDYMNDESAIVHQDLTKRDGIKVELYASNETRGESTVYSIPSTSVKGATSLTNTIKSADDSMSIGAVPLSVYVSYFKAVRKPMLVLFMVASFFMSNGASFYQQYTVAKWTEIPNLSNAISLRYMQRLVKAAWAVSGFLFLRSFLSMQMGIRASEHLHSQMLSSVFAATTSFFDSTPSGQLLARFGKEMETVDRGVPESISSVLFCFLNIFMSVGALAGVITPGMLVPLGAVTFLYIKAMALYRPAARDLKRAETKTRSPVYTHFAEALRGKDIIRSIPGARQRWSDYHRALTDKNLEVFATVKILDRWLSTRLETLGNSVVLTAAVAAVLLTRAGKLQPGLAGWGLTQSLAITGLMTWAVRVLTDMEGNFLSVLRVKELTQIGSEVDAGSWATMPRELSMPGEALRPLLPPMISQKCLAPLNSTSLVHSGWPWRGNVQFTNVSMKYNAFSKLVLRGVTLTVPAGSTLGIVGRTGSGKSSLLLTLFRLVEIEESGSIEIDGVDIRSVGLKELRQSLAIIPQDPVLFSGSIAYNLDATGTSTAEEMWAALEAASPTLAIQFRKMQGLATIVTEGGKNFSLGQRQLVCLARALLRRSRILILDEATSSVDSTTDQEVQQTIRREFVNKGVTVITVAHRLDTVLGYDKIAVLGDGEVLEYGAPNNLLLNPRGELRRLVDADRQNKRKGSRRPLAPVPANS